MQYGKTGFYMSLKNYYYSYLQFLSVYHVRNKIVCQHALFKSKPAVVSLKWKGNRSTLVEQTVIQLKSSRGWVGAANEFVCLPPFCPYYIACH